MRWRCSLADISRSRAVLPRFLRPIKISACALCCIVQRRLSHPAGPASLHESPGCLSNPSQRSGPGNLRLRGRPFACSHKANCPRRQTARISMGAVHIYDQSWERVSRLSCLSAIRDSLFQPDTTMLQAEFIPV